MRKFLFVFSVFFAILATFSWQEGQAEAAQALPNSKTNEKDAAKGAKDQEEHASADLQQAPELIADSELAERAVRVCLRDLSESAFKQAHANAMALLQVESKLEVPAVMRGMTLAAACVESGFRANAEGDHKFSKDGKTPMAIGILQMWPLYEKAYHVNRKNVKSSATGWLTHIKKQIPNVVRMCNPQSVEETWKIAWVTGVRAPKRGGRCRETINHYRIFQKIRAKQVHST